MSQIAELHLLIQSMSPNQKRNFTMQCSLNKSDSNSIVLFNILNKINKYDEEKLIKYLNKNKKTKLAENLATETTLLFKLVLKIIRSTSNEKSVEKRLINMFNDVVFLHERGLFLKSQRMLKKLKNDAHNYDQKTLLLEICKFDRRITRSSYEHKYLNSIEKINEREIELTKAILLEQKLRHIYDKVQYLIQKDNELRKDTENELLDEIESGLKKIDKNQCKCFNTKLLYLNSKAELLFLKSDHNTAFDYLEEMYEVYEKHSHIRAISGFQYIRFLNNYLTCIFKCNRSFDQFPQLLDKIKNTKTNRPDEEKIKFQNTYYLEFLYYINQGDFDHLKKMMPMLLDGLEKYGDKIEIFRKVVIWYNLMVYHFLNENFKSVNDWIKKILEEGKKSKRTDILNGSRLFLLLVHYESSEDTDILESLIRKVKRHFKDADNSNELVDLVTEMMNAHYKKAHLIKKDFDLALHRFNKIDRTKNKNLPYDEIEIWLKSKVYRKPMLSIAKQIQEEKTL